jgi:hypothetical protein
MPKYIATIIIEANSEAKAEEQLQAEPFEHIQNASVSLYRDVDLNGAGPLSKLSREGLLTRLAYILDSLHGGNYYNRFSAIAKERGRFSRMDTASMQLLLEMIESLRGSPELIEARLAAEDVLKVVSTRKGNLFAEDMREFIGRELDLTDAALLEAWETIEQDRMKKEGYK